MRGFNAARSELTLKVLFIGSAGCGKSSIVRSLAAAAASPVETISDEAGAIETTRCSFGKFDGRRVALHCWEVSYERFITATARPNPLHLDIILSGVHAVAIVFDALAAGGTFPSTAPANVFRDSTIAACVRPLEAVDEIVDALHERLFSTCAAGAAVPPLYLLAHKADTIASLAALRGAAASGSGSAPDDVSVLDRDTADSTVAALHVRHVSPLPRGALTASYAASTQLYACGLDADALSEFCAGVGIRRWFWTSAVEGPTLFGPGGASSALHGSSSISYAGVASMPATAASGIAAAATAGSIGAPSSRAAAGTASRSASDAAGMGSPAMPSAAGIGSGAPGVGTARCSSSVLHFLSTLLDDCLGLWSHESDTAQPLACDNVRALYTTTTSSSGLLF